MTTDASSDRRDYRRSKYRVGNAMKGVRPAMEFEEIGRRLGIGRSGAWMAYASGINKLRRRRRAIAELRALLSMKDRARKEHRI